ncbi:oligomeric Golgi complex subunit 6 [Roridomyces roridus]|uniref:Conserved oligomeric Golgi complex subunit 6 n=1 Tax=Roridomyces roridus TaxID=1738132 RepID=A0AAD7BTU9_9AGAR|nr:oligomeric Golgi complex subunit 6 [Roridomyces roridus]
MASPAVSPSSSTLQFDKKARTTQARNPVSLRLYKVLGTNFDDEATREALQTLSELYATSRVTGKPRDDDEAEQDLAGVEELLTESVPGESAARARRNLRRDMERKLAEGSHQFLKAFGEVDQKLEELQQHVAAMHASCDEAEIQLNLTNQASAMLLERAGSLSEERQQVENKKSIVTLFLTRFTLNEERDSSTPWTRLRVSGTDCRVLMAGEDGPTQAGLAIMESTSTHLTQGYEKIFRWCSHEFRQMGRDMQVEVDTTMREAIRRLAQTARIVNALSDLSQARQATLMSSFITALTRGGPSGLPRPIELHAHDPLRYVGDMLAWVHQAIAAEREFLESLFGLQADGRMVGSVRVFQQKSEEEDWIRELMDLAVGKLCVPLKESSIISYKIANLLAILYDHHAITEVAYKVFYDAIETQGRALLRATLDLDDPSLTPPLAILDHAQILREIMNVYESSLLGDEGEEEQTAGFQRILDVTVDPAVEMCTNNSEEKKRLRPRWDREVYVLNCLSYLQEPFPFTSQKRETLQAVVDENYKNIMVDAGIDKIAETCLNHDDSEPLSRVPATLPAQLQTALRNFSLWLSGLEVVQSPRLSQLTAQRLHIKIHQAALERMVQSYQLISAATLLGTERPFGQINLLRQIFGFVPV